MKSLWLFTLLCCALCLAWASGADQLTSDEKLAELEHMTSSQPVIDMNAADYNRYFIGQKDYYIVAMFTALQGQRNCVLCKKISPEYTLAAKAAQQSREKGVVFVSFDYDNARKVFLRHEIESVPVIWVFPPTGRPTKQDKMDDMYRREVSAEGIAKFVGERTGKPITVHRPINWLGRIATVCATMIGLYLLVTVFPANLFLRFANVIMCVTSIGLVLLFTSGYMWTQIRGAGMYTRDHQGRLTVFSGSGGQTQAETMSVMLLNSMTVLGFICMIGLQRHHIPPKVRDGLCLVALAVAVAGMAALQYVYRTYKNSSYPFKLFL